VRTLDGDLAGAAADFERARDCVRQLGGNSHDDVMIAMRLADLRLRDGDPAGAREYLEVLRRQRAFGPGEPLQQIFIGAIEGGIAVAEKDGAATARAYEDLRDLLCTLGSPSLMNAHVGAVGQAIASGLALKLGRIDDAEQHARAGYAQAVLTNDKPIIASVGTAVAAWAQARGWAREAAVVLGASTRLRGSDDATSPTVIELVAALREDLGEGYEVAYAEGLMLDVDAATARVDPQGVQAVAAVDPVLD
jgi:hypothetical protein